MIEIFEASTNGSSCGSCPYTPRKLGKRKRTLNSTLIQDRRELRVAVEFPNWSMEGEPMHPPVNVQLRRVRLSRHRSLSSPLDTASWGVCTGKMKTQHCCTGVIWAGGSQGQRPGALSKENQKSEPREWCNSLWPLPHSQGLEEGPAHVQAPVHSENQGPLLKNYQEGSHVDGRGLNQEQSPSECKDQWCISYISKASLARGIFKRPPCYHSQRKCMQMSENEASMNCRW